MKDIQFTFHSGSYSEELSAATLEDFKQVIGETLVEVEDATFQPVTGFDLIADDPADQPQLNEWNDQSNFL